MNCTIRSQQPVSKICYPGVAPEGDREDRRGHNPPIWVPLPSVGELSLMMTRLYFVRTVSTFY